MSQSVEEITHSREGDPGIVLFEAHHRVPGTIEGQIPARDDEPV
jgi:hypothetical protein